jgi:membrane glycosyltransferase
MTVRNEDPERAVARLRVVRDSVDATDGAAFGYFLMSDTSDPAIAAREAKAVAEPGSDRIVYRQRDENIGFKAGNIMDFCRRWGDDFELMVTLDADSLMSGPAILHLVRIMRDNPKFGIVQGLVTGLPSSSVFARIFQFGMRHGMRSYTVGQAWWTGDCGPFWGHNAIIRVAPFRDHCALPVLSGRPPFGGHVLSHDQVEAVLMRRAGWEVRLQPVAGGSWEDSPPTLLEYVRRDLRWCQGNLQYFRLVGLPGLRPVSRFQLVWAILMFAGIPAWTLLMALLPVAAGVGMVAHAPWVEAVYGVFVLMWFAPKLSGYLHTAASVRRRRRYGGLPAFLAGVASETVFSLVQTSITSLSVTGFVGALVIGRSAAWAGQVRDARTVSWREAVRAFWPQTLFGVWVNGGLLVVSPALLPWALPFTLGYLLAVPFAVITASERLGERCVRFGLCAVPEEIDPPQEVLAVGAGGRGPAKGVSPQMPDVPAAVGTASRGLSREASS